MNVENVDGRSYFFELLRNLKDIYLMKIGSNLPVHVNRSKDVNGELWEFPMDDCFTLGVLKCYLFKLGWNEVN